MAGQFQDGSASLVSGAHVVARPSVTFGWDEFSLLVLSVVSAGSVPMAVTSGIAVSAIAWGSVPVWVAVVIGLAGWAGALAVSFAVLYGLTRGAVRQRLIPLARRLFGGAT
jgi:hypothetical protein